MICRWPGLGRRLTWASGVLLPPSPPDQVLERRPTPPVSGVHQVLLDRTPGGRGRTPRHCTMRFCVPPSAQYRISIHYWVFSPLVMIGDRAGRGEVIMTNGRCRRESHRHRESMLFFLSPIFGISKVGRIWWEHRFAIHHKQQDEGGGVSPCKQARGWGDRPATWRPFSH